MTYEEAKEAIKLEGFTIEATLARMASFSQGIEKAQEALEKQIAKNAYDDARKLCVCPNCKRLLEGYEYFCWNCGQRIDFSEVEE